MQRDPYGRPLSVWERIDLYTDALIAAPGITVGAIMIWASWGDRFGLVFGLLVLGGSIWAGVRALNAMNRRE